MSILPIGNSKVPFCQCLYEIQNQLTRTKYCLVPCEDQKEIADRQKKDKENEASITPTVEVKN